MLGQGSGGGGGGSAWAGETASRRAVGRPKSSALGARAWAFDGVLGEEKGGVL